MHRLSDESKFEWCESMAELEEVFGALYSVAETVIAESAVAECDRLKKMTCWVSTTEIDVMTLNFPHPKSPIKNYMRSSRKQSLRRLQNVWRNNFWSS